TIIWGNTFGDPLHSGFENSPATVQPRTTEFFPTDRVYNWPNPVYGGSTQIRYFLKTSADVKVKIFDLAGDKVAEMSGPGIGGIDNEVKWDVSNVQSGLYIARIEANGSGERGVALVKIAVVK
ncbi:MAG: T9SS type A sorting domain-containing protein, partial [Bacteroidota bacterium]